jgi:hypothetical protein
MSPATIRSTLNMCGANLRYPSLFMPVLLDPAARSWEARRAAMTAFVGP